MFFPVNRAYPTLQLQFTAEQSCGLFLVSLLIFTLLMKQKIETKRITRFLGWFGISALLLSLSFELFNFVMRHINHLYSGRFMSGIVPNKSMNCILIASLFPFVYEMVKGTSLALISLIAMIAIAFLSDSSCGLLATGVALFIMFWRYTHNLSSRIAAIIIALTPLLVASFFHHHLLDGTGRFEMYRLFLSGMSTTDWIIGKGPGTFFPYGVYTQAIVPGAMGDGFYLYMHSDPLQYLFEYGVLGCLFLAVPLYYTLRFAGPIALPAILALLSGSIFYYPFHFPVHLFVFFLFMKIAVNNHNDMKDHERLIEELS